MKRALLPALLTASCTLVGEAGGPATPENASVGAAAPGAAIFTPATTTLPRIQPPFDPSSTASAIAAWPRIVPGVHSRSVTSFDRGGGNGDGFGSGELYVDGTKHVLFDELGPGVVRTLWFTSAVDGNSPLGIGPLEFYFDDETTPRITIDADALFAGKTSPFFTPLVAANHESTGGFASWAPLTFRSHLRIASLAPVGFYQVHWDSLPADWDVATTTSADTALGKRFAEGASPKTLEPLALDGTRAGKGAIDVFRFVPTATPSDAALRAARLQIWFDKASDPQVDVPLGFFFGSARGVAPVHSIVWTMEPLLFESRMPMPFHDGFRVAVTGLAGTLATHVDSAATGATLEARFSGETTVVGGPDHVYADVTGAGKLVATVLGVDPESPSNKQWWEGDMRTRADDARSPIIHGTGHEDDHLGGWSNEFLSRPYSLPMQGCPRTDITDDTAVGQKNGATTMYRFWPGIAFYRSLRHSVEHGTNDGRSALYESATFLYRSPDVRLVKTDGFVVTDDAAAKAHAFSATTFSRYALTSAFEGELADPLSLDVESFTAPITFDLAIDPNNAGVELRRLADHQEHAAERVRVGIEVDGLLVTTILTAGIYSPARRWNERDVFLPAQVTKGKSKVTIRLGSQTPFTAASFEAWSVKSS